jgi:hypothetical protein
MDHLSKNCPHSYPDAASYHTLSQSDVDCACCSQGSLSGNQNVPPTAKVEKQRLAKVAAVGQASTSQDENSFIAQGAHPITVMMGKPGQMVYLPPNDANVIEGDSDSDTSLDGNIRILLPVCKPHIKFPCFIHQLTTRLQYA